MDDDDTMGCPPRIDRRSQPSLANRQQEDVTLQRRSNTEARIMMLRERYIDSEHARLLSAQSYPQMFPA